MTADVEYYRSRMAEELSAASTSGSAAAKQCHRELAEAYLRRLEALGLKEELSRVELAA